MRWSGYLVPAFSETYTFHVLSNNGIRVSVDRQLVIDRTENGVIITASGDSILQAGISTPLLVEYYEDTNTAEVHLKWESASQAREIIDGDHLVQTAAPDGPPVAVNDNAGELSPSEPVAIDVLSNDFDYQGNLDPATVVIVEQALGTTVEFDAASGMVILQAGAPVGTNSFSYTVTDSNGSISNRALVEFSIESHAESWRVTNFPDALGDLLISGWDADPDKDGHANAIEYATGSNPNDATSIPQMPLTETTLGIEWEIPRAEGIETVLSIQQNAKLQTWSPPGPQVQVLEDSPARLRVRIDPGAAPAEQFLRLAVTIPGT